jgi:hypothetical protein
MAIMGVNGQTTNGAYPTLCKPLLMAHAYGACNNHWVMGSNPIESRKRFIAQLAEQMDANLQGSRLMGQGRKDQVAQGRKIEGSKGKYKSGKRSMGYLSFPTLHRLPHEAFSYIDKLYIYVVVLAYLRRIWGGNAASDTDPSPKLSPDPC